MRFLAAIALSLGVLSATPALADATIPTKDAAKSKDVSSVPRYEGSFILDYDYRAFTDITMPLSRLEKTGTTDNRNNNVFAPKQKAELEGARTRLIYLIPEGRSPLEVVRNYQEAIAAKGGKTLYQCKDVDCGGNARYGVDTGGGDQSLSMYSYPPGEFKAPSFSNTYCVLTTWISDQRYAVMKFGEPGAETYVSVHAFVMDENSSCKAFNGRTMAIVNILEQKPREQKMVTVSSSDLSKGINSAGHIAVYGILFDFDKADIKAESKPQLDEIAKLLKSDLKLHVLIVGHTDNKGQLAYNQGLSGKRAKAVVDTLTKSYGVPAGQMTAVGVGPAAPVASNDTEEGQAKNRRVELVKM